MARQVVIDRDILGWVDEHTDELSRKYQNVLPVSKHPDLPQRNSDVENAKYCKQNDCDMITGDTTAHTHFFEAGIKSVRITKMEPLKDKDIYLIHIEE